MPVYVYRRQDGSIFEVEQRITADRLVSCPTTGQKVERVLQPFTPHYRGYRVLLDGPPAGHAIGPSLTFSIPKSLGLAATIISARSRSTRI